MDEGPIAELADEEAKLHPSHAAHFVGGQFSGMCGVAASYPLDTLKVTMQLQEPPVGMVTTAKQLFHQNGVAGLYRGMLSPMLGVGVLFSCAFGVNGVCTSFVHAHHSQQGKPKELSLGESMVCGGISGAVSAFPRTLVERVKCFAQAHNITAVQATRTLYQSSGLRGLFKGLATTQAREIPQFAFYYPIYEATINALNPKRERRVDLPGWKLMLAGANTGVWTWFITYPIDLIKTRVQANEGKYSSTLECIQQSYRESGIRVFTRGLMPTCLRAMPFHASVFVVFEHTLAFFNKHGM
eukprot:c7997_g2_i1.p1 GENE.c7997_g2_i1~~c7997_g2_i1.p1  ORF type:complete len:298 (+),score=75.75 c7997_g2_i1:128-1021(+)